MASADTESSLRFEFIPGISPEIAEEAKMVLSQVGLPEGYSNREDFAYEILKSHDKTKEIADMCMTVRNFCDPLMSKAH